MVSVCRVPSFLYVPDLFVLFSMSVSVCGCVRRHTRVGGHRLDPLGLGLTGGCEAPGVGTGLGFSARAVNDLTVASSLHPWFC